ncbi:MAG: transcriptional regulator GlxA family with amidase domain [Parasphingorhabdus sp.]|jgi:transcriptional regulator GlxA family with amidase domain
MGKSAARPSIVLLASEETSAAVLYGLFDVLSTVGAVYPDMVSGVAGEELLDVRIAARNKEHFRCFGNIPIEPHVAINQIERADAVIVCDMYTPIDTPPTGSYIEEIAWLKNMHAGGALLASVCSGSAVLVETGLLDGCEISGHWAYRHMFKKYYPRVNFVENVILNMSAIDNRVVTTAGVTSWQDLALYLVSRFCGVEHAANTAKIHLLTGHNEGQSTYASMTCNALHSDALVHDCQDFIGKNYAEANPVAKMIEFCGINRRTFSRRFKSATGYDPLEYVQSLRMENARRLLETSDLGIDEVSDRVGYEDTASFRRLFKRKSGVTPVAYRKKFSNLTFSAV